MNTHSKPICLVFIIEKKMCRSIYSQVPSRIRCLAVLSHSNSIFTLLVMAKLDPDLRVSLCYYQTESIHVLLVVNIASFFIFISLQQKGIRNP